MKKLLGLAFAAVVSFFAPQAHAQLGCLIQSQAVLLGQFSDAAPPSSITPANVRNVICSVLNPFTPTAPGAVPASGGGTANFLRADGAWAPPPGGAGGTPGGSPGQLQYNNAGAFGGFTLGGDCTIAVPNVTCTKTNGVAFAPSATTDTTNAANISTNTLPAGRLPALTGDVTSAGNTAATSVVRLQGRNVSSAVPTTGQVLGWVPGNNDWEPVNQAGGSTAPGGTSGQTQYNNAGAFGGYTPSGDVAVVASTGVETIQPNVVTYAKLQQASAGARVLANPTGSAANYQESPLGGGLCFNGINLVACAPDRTVSSGAITFTASDFGGQVNNSNPTTPTATIPASGVLGANQTILLVNQSVAAAPITITNSQVVNGLPLSTKLYPGGFYSYAGNGTTADAFGFPGFSSITTSALMAYADGSGAPAAAAVYSIGGGIGSSLAAGISFDTNSGGVKYQSAQADQAYLFSAPISGNTITMTSTHTTYIINPAGTIATLTVVFPSTATIFDGFIVKASSSQAVTTLTLTPGTGQTISNPVTSLSAGGSFSYQWHLSDNTWYPLDLNKSAGAGGGGGNVTSVGAGAGVSTALCTSGGSAITGAGSIFADASYFAFYQGGLILSNDGTTPATIIDTAAGAAASDDSACMMKLGAFTKTTGAWALGSGNGCLDTGAIAASTWYHVFVIERSDTGVVDELCSTSAGSPTFPTSYNKKRRIGSFKTDGSAHILTFTQVGTAFYWGTQTLDVNISTLGTTSALEVLNVPPGVKVQPLCRYTVGGTGNAVLLTSPDETDVAPTATTPMTAAPGFDQLDNSLTVGVQNTVCPYLTTNLSSQIRARATAASTTLSIVTRGWID